MSAPPARDCPSIHPQHSASHTAFSYDSASSPTALRSGTSTHTPDGSVWCSSSQRRQAASERGAIWSASSMTPTDTR